MMSTNVVVAVVVLCVCLHLLVGLFVCRVEHTNRNRIRATQEKKAIDDDDVDVLMQLHALLRVLWSGKVRIVKYCLRFVL